MSVEMTRELSRGPVLPLEIWLMVFEHATALPKFFDSYYVNGSLWSPFRDEGSITFDAFRAHLTHRRA